ncbi:hypothetical protein SAMN05444365_101896 [Micromonospora pattaloongensis]|uniref:Uncharacterized protein n=2 Tax=Micromonospora pattaloongensis TaxID=405436 RepID=A0A1H3HLU9_9ACTN|nr:hypothetical protein SAMN05444365_101896 [Micromonospora pattaloongensis]
MFAIGRRRTHRELLKGELGESLDHFMQAATHAANGVGATVGPRVNAAREFVGPTADRVRNTASHGWESAVTVLAPLAVAAAEGARQAGGAARKAKPKKPRMMKKKGSQMSRKRWPMLAGLVAAGAAVGAAGVMMRRRRSSQQWEEYDPTQGLDPVHAGSTAMAGPSSGASGDDPVRASMASMARNGATASGSTDGTADLTMSEQPAAPMTGGTKKQGDKLAGDVAGNAAAGSRDGRG